MTDNLPYFPFYVRDFASDGKVEAMSTESVGAYILLLCKAWHERPAGSIPDHDPTLARWTGLALDRWSQCRADVLAPFTKRTDGRWHQKRMQAEHRKLLELRRLRSKAGAQGNVKRWQSDRTRV